MRLIISREALKTGLFGLVAGSLLFFAGCSTTGPVKTDGNPAAGGAAGAGAEVNSEARSLRIAVESINVVGEGDKVLVETTGPVKYTVFKLSDPPRLVVDMPGVDLQKVSPSIKVDNQFLLDINVVNYGGDESIGRIIIGLKEGVEHSVKSGENSVLVSLSRDEGAASTDALAASEPSEAAPGAEAVAPETPQSAGETPAETRAEEVRLATKILKVDVARDKDSTTVTVRADGVIGNYNSFELDSPSRVIIDLWGVANSSGQDIVRVKNKFVKAVRIGSHGDKVRLVFDSARKSNSAYSLERRDNTLVMTFGKRAMTAKDKNAVPVSYAAQTGEKAVAVLKTAQAPMEGAPEGVTESAPEGVTEGAPEGVTEGEEKTQVPETQAKEEQKPAEEAVATGTIEKIEFKKVADKGRLTVKRSGETAYAVKETADRRTVIIDIKGAAIPEELVRTLDAAKLLTPVATISSYQESLEKKTVRILVKLSEKALYESREENGDLVVEFASAALAEAKPAPKAPSPMKEAAQEAVEFQYAGKKIDLDMTDANITDILRLLAEVSNLNIIASDDVKGTISLRLKNVPWDQAFDIALKAKDLDKIREGNVVRVAPASKIRQEREALLAAKKAQEKLEETEIRYISINYGTAADLEGQVKKVLTERGDVTSEKRTNTLIVKDIKAGLEKASDLIRRLDTAIPQVLIEARIVEASNSFARDLGIQWGVDYKTGGNLHTDTFGSMQDVFGQAAHDPGVQSSTKTGGGAYPAEKQSWPVSAGVTNYAVNLPATGTAGTLGALGFILGKAGPNPLILDLRLSAGETEGRLKTISRPRIITMDNKEAKIEQGESIPFETTSATGTATTFIDANLSLTVTPHITPDGSVLMKIKASRNSIGTFRTSSGEPSINKKESSTEVLVKDGETTVIGGIVVSDKSESDSGIPFLKDIPVLGYLFKSKSVSDSQTELLIFITPTIMKETAKIPG